MLWMDTVESPTHCVCGQTFTTDQAMICRNGDLTFVRHNDLRDITAKLLSTVCNDVAIELPLQPLSGENLNPVLAKKTRLARADIRAHGFWGRQHSHLVPLPL